MLVDRCGFTSTTVDKLFVTEKKTLIISCKVNFLEGAFVFGIGISSKKLIKLSL